MTVVRFLTLTGGSVLSLFVGCVGNFKNLDCIIFSVGFLRISLNSVRVSQFTSKLEQEILDDLVSANMYASGTYSCLLEDIYVRSLLLPPASSFDTELVRCSGPIMRRRSSYLWKLNSCRNMLWKSKRIN